MIRKPTKDLHITKPTENPNDWLEIISNVKGKDDINKLLGACRRELDEDPDLVGVRMMAGLCLISEGNMKHGSDDLSRAFRSLKRIVPINQDRFDISRKVTAEAKRLAPSRLDIVLGSMLEADPSIDLLRFSYENSKENSDFRLVTVSLLLQNILNQDRSNKEVS
jgi:hypothetical protein